jgi:hypothetical protein
MREDERTTYGVELLLQEPELVAWLSDYAQPEEDDDSGDDEPPRAA